MIENSEKQSIVRETNVHDTEKYEYTCKYCRKQFIPKRRRAQKYCSNSCRSKAYRLRKLAQKENPQLVEKTNNKIDSMSIAGVGNAAAGAAFVEVVKAVFTGEENKAATKKDIKSLESKLRRYHKIIKIPKMLPNTIPYYNMETKEVEFFMKEFLPIE